MKKAFVLFYIFILSGCMTLPVHGQFTSGEETEFIGSATGYITKRGDLEVVDITGLRCKGEFKYNSSATGFGDFKCNDSRTGNFTFISEGNNGEGLGEMSDGQKFKLNFGSSAISRYEHTKKVKLVK